MQAVGNFLCKSDRRFPKKYLALAAIRLVALPLKKKRGFLSIVFVANSENRSEKLALNHLRASGKERGVDFEICRFSQRISSPCYPDLLGGDRQILSV